MGLWISDGNGGLQPALQAGSVDRAALRRRVERERLQARLLREAPLTLIAQVLAGREGTC